MFTAHCNSYTRIAIVLFIALGITSVANAQEIKKQNADTTQYESQEGMVSLGVRTIVSCFSDGDPHAFGSGVGGHFRVQLTERVNTEWFGDIISNNIDNKAHRTDYHVGWSVMYYLIPTKGFKRKLTPYVLAGHCFDETVIKINGPDGAKGSRFSSAVQGGVGCHYNITPKFNISLAVQYMMHLGKELDAEENAEGNMVLVTHKNAGWEGHLLVSLSANLKLGRLWKNGKR